jgi:hypothetical protein
MWSKRVRSATVGPGVEVGALIACLDQTQTRLGGERERLGTPDRSPSTDPRTHMHRREGPPWLPLGRLEREGVGIAAPTMAGEWWRE